MGDPAGVGPEAIVGAWREPAVHRFCRPLVVGHPRVLRRAVDLLGLELEVQEIATSDEALPTAALIPCLSACAAEAADVPPGAVDRRGGQAAYDVLSAAAGLALTNQIDAICTAPLHKGALWLAGHHYPGHTELLAERLRHRSLCDDALPARGQGGQRPARLGDRPCDPAHGAARRVRLDQPAVGAGKGAAGRRRDAAFGGRAAADRRLRAKPARRRRRPVRR